MRKVILIASLAFTAAAGTAAAGWGTKPAATPQAGQPDCDKLAAMPNSPMSVETCKSMMGLAQVNATVDRSAVHPGDDQMSCSDIDAEMSTMRGVGPSQATKTEGSQAAGEYQATLKRQQNENEATARAQTAAIQATVVTQTIAGKATGGVAKPDAALALEKGFEAEDTARGKQMAEERKPQEARLVNAGGAVAQDMSKSIQANPRFGRLIQLAMAKKCREPGRGKAP